MAARVSFAIDPWCARAISSPAVSLSADARRSKPNCITRPKLSVAPPPRANSAPKAARKPPRTARGRDYLGAQRTATQRIEAELRTELGPAGFTALTTLLDALGGEGEQVRMRDYFGAQVRQ